MNKRLLVISDIHGCYDEFRLLLHEVKYDAQKDQLILLGDYVNRGKDSLQVVQYVYELVQAGAIALKGNHDEWFVKYLRNVDNTFARFTSDKVGGYATLQSFLPGVALQQEDNAKYQKMICRKYSHLVDFLEQLPYTFETATHLFVHAGVDPEKQLHENSSLNFIMSRWHFINEPCRLKKVIVFGHTTCVMIHGKPEPWVKENKIGLDGGCCFGYQLNCLEINEKNELATYFVKAIE